MTEANPLRTLMEKETGENKQRPREDGNQLLQVVFYLRAIKGAGVVNVTQIK